MRYVQCMYTHVSYKFEYNLLSLLITYVHDSGYLHYCTQHDQRECVRVCERVCARESVCVRAGVSVCRRECVRLST